MTKSMTAFARETATTEPGDLTWEIRSVNHRYLELFVRLPEELRGLESAVRERLASRLARGKVDCSLRYQASPGMGGELRLNHPYLEKLLAVGAEVAHIVGGSPNPSAFELLRWPGVLQEEEKDLTALGERALELLHAALDSLIATREREGARLAQGIRERCDLLAEKVAAVRERMPGVLVELRQRLVDRLAELRAELDANRLEQELVLLAQRLDVDEEMDRLAAHVAEVQEVLNNRGPVGRRLDFLMQELNREANTLGSKSTDVELTRLAVDMKVLIEQMREQVQNIE
jgi:uncharacterized protein (TIGR00255 family)